MADITRNEYWAEIRSIGDDLAREAKAGEFGTGETAREQFGERLHEAIDGHSWVIYTHSAQQVTAHSDNDNGYSAENFGVESIVTDGNLNWSVIAFGALYGDVVEYLFSVDGFDINDPNPDDE